MKYLKILPFIIGVIFIVSGISKLISIDDFEQYIYGLNWFSLDLTQILSRLLISVETAAGILFILRIYKRITSVLTLIMLAAFTSYILYAALTGDSEDCHCFGSLIRFNHTFSILKNLILGLLILVYIKNGEEKFGKRRHITALFVMSVSFVTVFTINLPAGILNRKSEIRYCEPCVKKILKTNQPETPKAIICFFSVNCKYCKLAAQRISVISRKANNSRDIVFYIWDEKNQSEAFFKENKLPPIKTFTLPVLQFMEATSGIMPLIILYENGKIVDTFRFSNMDEGIILDFLKNYNIQ
jgi:uncharacterized membrane protein YphA (DoxX/SURF4 family)/thioredoxin-related protein